MADITFTVTATNTAGASASANALVTAQAPQLVPVTFGETAVLAGDDFGNANILLAQKTTQPYPGILSQLAFWTGQVAGQLRLGINADGAGGNPGALEAQSPALAPVANDWTVHNFVNGPFLQAGPKWLAYTPSSNSLHFRSGPGGTLRHVNRSFQAMPATFPANPSTVWDGSHFSFYATVLVDSSLLPPPPEPGFISYFNPAAANWSDPSIIGGQPWYNHHGGRAWSITKPDDYTLDFEVRQGDPEAIDVGGERAEISSGASIPPGALIDVKFDYTLKAGIPLVGQSGVAWATMDQIHGDVRPSWIGFTPTGGIFVNANPDVAYDQREWQSPWSIEVGRTYRIQHQVKRSAASDGWVKLWVDGVLVADFSNIRVGGLDNYVKLGIYRGWNGLVTQTTACRYSNIVVTVT